MPRGTMADEQPRIVGNCGHSEKGKKAGCPLSKAAYLLQPRGQSATGLEMCLACDQRVRRAITLGRNGSLNGWSSLSRKVQETLLLIARHSGFSESTSLDYLLENLCSSKQQATLRVPAVRWSAETKNNALKALYPNGVPKSIPPSRRRKKEQQLSARGRPKGRPRGRGPKHRRTSEFDDEIDDDEFNASDFDDGDFDVDAAERRVAAQQQQMIAAGHQHVSATSPKAAAAATSPAAASAASHGISREHEDNADADEIERQVLESTQAPYDGRKKRKDRTGGLSGRAPPGVAAFLSALNSLDSGSGYSRRRGRARVRGTALTDGGAARTPAASLEEQAAEEQHGGALEEDEDLQDDADDESYRRTLSTENVNSQHVDQLFEARAELQHVLSTRLPEPPAA